MQVLCVLAGAEGRVVGRDELIARCWDGRIVGENAVARTISRLRWLSESFGGAFAIDAIAKVGYRLRPAAAHDRTVAVGAALNGAAPVALGDPAGYAPLLDRVNSPQPLLREPDIVRSAPARFTRRGALAAGFGVAGLIGAGAGVWRATAPERAARAEARMLVAKAREAERGAGMGEFTGQAAAYYRRAVALDPRSAQAWGGMALAEVTAGFERGEAAAWLDRLRSAATQALRLDARNSEARLALALSRARFGRWAEAEPELRRLAMEDGAHWRCAFAYGELLADVGRWRDAEAAYALGLARDSLLPLLRLRRAEALWHGGRLIEAQREIEAAWSLWPLQFWVWNTRLDFYAFNGRPQVTLAQLMDGVPRPPNAGPEWVTLVRASAQALLDGSPVALALGAAAQVRARRRGSYPSYLGAMYLAALGAPVAAFDVLARYFQVAPWRVANRAPAGGPWDDRKTRVMFTRPVAPLRSDPRWTALVQTVGLEDYWRRTGTRPDFRD